MKIQVQCECGAKLAVDAAQAGRRGLCPYCKNKVDIPAAPEEIIEAELVPKPEPDIVFAELVKEFLDPPTRIPSRSTLAQPAPSAASSGPRPAWTEVLVNNLLSPRTIKWMLVLGGALLVLGLVVWLKSLGLFNDPKLVAGGMTLASLVVFLAGLSISISTEQKMVGQALTFLGCVLLPLNLWYFHAQGLITLGSGLWVGGLVCCLFYVAAVVLLRDPLFIYAVAAGVTLTAVLILGDLGLINQWTSFIVLFLSLAAVFIHLERLFFWRDELKKYGLPFFWCGQIHLLAALIILLVVQVLGWLLVPLQQQPNWHWGGNLLTEMPILSAVFWLIGGYLYLYSDLVVRKIGIYVFAASFCLLMFEATLIAAAQWQLEYQLVVLATTSLIVAIAFYFVRDRFKLLERFAAPCVVLFSLPPVLIGLLLHVRATSVIAEKLSFGYETTSLFVGAMLWSAACARICSALFEKTNRRTAAFFLFLSAAGLLAALAGALRVFGLTAWVHQAPILMLLPICYLLAARFERGRIAERPLGWIAQTAAGLILGSSLLASLTDLTLRVQDARLLQGESDNLLLALVFGLGATFYGLAVLVRKRNAYYVLAAVCGAAMVWQLLVYVRTPLEFLGLIYALPGLGLLLAGIKLGVQQEERYSQMGAPYRVTTGDGAMLMQIGHGVLAFAWCAAWFGCLGVFASAGGENVRPIVGLFLCSAIGGVAAFVSRHSLWRILHGLAACLLACTGAFQAYSLLDLNPWMLVEYTALCIGIVLLIAALVGRLREKDGKPNDAVTLGLVLGSILAVIPLLLGVIVHRATEGVFLFDELGLVAVTILMIVIGVGLQTKFPVIFGGLGLAVYCLVLIVSIAYFPQVAIGAYLALAGGLLFGIGLMASIFRERIIALPIRFKERKGVFQLLTWR